MTTPSRPPASPAKSTAKPTGKSTAAPATGSKLPADTLTALNAALACENAAIWAYGLVAAYDQTDADDINAIRSGHLARRDATANVILLGGGQPSRPAAAYTLPTPVTNAASARALGVVIETDCAAAWRSVIGATDSADLRGTALAGLSDSAVWLTTLKLQAKNATPTVPFPGQ